MLNHTPSAYCYRQYFGGIASCKKENKGQISIQAYGTDKRGRGSVTIVVDGL